MCNSLLFLEKSKKNCTQTKFTRNKKKLIKTILRIEKQNKKKVGREKILDDNDDNSAGDDSSVVRRSILNVLEITLPSITIIFKFLI